MDQVKDWHPKKNDKILALAISLLRDGGKCANPSEISEILNEACLAYPANKALLNYEPKSGVKLDAFDFLKKLNRPAIRELFKGESADKIALISYFLNREEMSKMIAVLAPSAIVEIIIQIAKLSRISFLSIKHTALAYSTQLKTRASKITNENPAKIITPPPFKFGNQSAVAAKNQATRNNAGTILPTQTSRENNPETSKFNWQIPQNSNYSWQNLPSEDEIETIQILV